MAGPLPKPAGRRSGHGARPTSMDLTLSDRTISPIDDAPAPTADWLVETKKQWVELWQHAITAAYDRTLHEYQLRRMFDLRDERARLRRVVRKTPMVEGSQGQPRINPLVDRISTIDGELLKLEMANGMNPASLLKLGINYGQAKKSLDDLSRGIYGDDEEDGGSEEEDPRIIDLAPPSSRRKKA